MFKLKLLPFLSYTSYVFLYPVFDCLLILYQL